MRLRILRKESAQDHAKACLHGLTHLSLLLPSVLSLTLVAQLLDLVLRLLWEHLLASSVGATRRLDLLVELLDSCLGMRHELLVVYLGSAASSL